MDPLLDAVPIRSAVKETIVSLSVSFRSSSLTVVHSNNRIEDGIYQAIIMTTIESSFDIDLALVEGYIGLDVVGFLLDFTVSMDMTVPRLV